MKPIKTSGGRAFIVLGDPSAITMERLPIISERLDSDPRIASVSVVAHPDSGQEFLRAVAPAGCAIAVATDVESLAGILDDASDPEALRAWAQRASERGLWHDWWLSSARDVAKAPAFIEESLLDVRETADLSSSRSATLNTKSADPASLTMTIDATWLGPHQTGAQVLTTAAIEALAANPRVAQIRLVGINELPPYAAHLSDLEPVTVVSADQTALDGPSDVIWYPNQIDQRVDMSAARSLARRVITTYLDLIAYDIPRYHASPDAWAAYRALQRRIALSVDGITTISADVAHRLVEEVPRLAPERVEPIPLGLDHITASRAEPGDDLADLRGQLGSRPFLLVLGNDFQHKNRDFAIEVWEKTLNRGVNCDLVLAGLHVKSSSSRSREQELLAQHTNLRGQAHLVDHVSSQSREWLLSNAAAVIYPSSAEGFGFVPYEAAALGTPSSFAAFGPLAEISQVPDVPRGWSVDEFADDIAALLADPDKAQERVSRLREAISRSTWETFAGRLLDFVYRIDAMEPVDGALLAGTASDAAALNAVLSSKTWRATAPLRRLGKRIRG